MRYVSSAMALALAAITTATAGAQKADAPMVVEIAKGDQAEAWALTIQAHGQPVGKLGAEAIAALFRFYDHNSDEQLDATEAIEIASPAGLRQLPLGRLLPTMVKRPAEMDRDQDGVVRLDEFQAFYAASTGKGVWLTCDVTPRNREMNAALLCAMEIEPGDQIDELQFQQVMSRLAKLDTNADQLISPGEILTGHVYPGISPTRMVSGDNTSPYSFGDLSISRQNASSSGHPWAIDLDQVDLVLTSHSENVSARLHIAEADTSRAETALVDLASQFASSVGGGNQLKLSEVAGMQNQVDLQQLIPLADRNRDDMLTAEEFAQWQAVVRAYLRSVVVVTLLDFEQNLFTALDENFDGSLSTQELSTAWQTLKAASVIHDGQLQPQRLPYQLRIIISQGPCQQLLDQRKTQGPPWFQAMDRNGDGQISRDEFPASSEKFTSIDQDGDGILSLQDVLADAKGRR